MELWLKICVGYGWIDALMELCQGLFSNFLEFATCQDLDGEVNFMA